VGHEVDFTIADMVADHRAPTPSAAAELLSPDQREWQQRLQAMETSLVRLIRRRLNAAMVELGHLQRRLKHPGAQLREQSQRLDELEQRLVLAQKNLLQRRRGELALLESRLQARSPLPRVRQLQMDIQRMRQRMTAAMQLQLARSGDRLGHLARMLDSLSPLGTLQRGYAIITDRQGKVVSDTAGLAVGDKVEARLAKGLLGLTINKVVPGD
jgi:exodeoxyribonuclease VII large subunit